MNFHENNELKTVNISKDSKNKESLPVPDKETKLSTTCISSSIAIEIIGNDRLLTNSLLDYSSCDAVIQQYDEKPIDAHDWAEATSAWRQTAPYPKYFTASKKRKPAEQSDVNGIIRCVRDDDSDHYLKFWRLAVEPLTFRYIPNNASYRLIKFAKENNGWYTIRKSKPEKVVLVQDDTTTNFSGRNSRNKRRFYKKKHEPRSRSTNSEGTVTRRTPKITNIQAHDRAQLTRSVSDLYMENLNSKLHQVEHQVKKNMENNKNIVDFPSDSEKEPNGFYRKSKPGVSFTTNIEASFDSSSIASSTNSQNLRPLEKVTPKQRIKIGIRKTNDADTKSSQEVSYMSFGSSVVFEGIETELRTLDTTEKIDSYLLGKRNQNTKPPLQPGQNSTPTKKKGAILKYTTANNCLKTKDRLWEPQPLVEASELPISSELSEDLPQISGKQIPVSFTTHRLLRQ